MLRWLLGAAVAAVVLFLWGFVFWSLRPFRLDATLRRF